MIDNRDYVGKVFTSDEQGRIGTWPLPLDPDEPVWFDDVPTEPLPVLVQPGVLHDRMEVER